MVLPKLIYLKKPFFKKHLLVKALFTLGNTDFFFAESSGRCGGRCWNGTLYMPGSSAGNHVSPWEWSTFYKLSHSLWVMGAACGCFELRLWGKIFMGMNGSDHTFVWTKTWCFEMFKCYTSTIYRFSVEKERQSEMSCLLSFTVITLFTAGIQIGMLAIFSRGIQLPVSSAS